MGRIVVCAVLTVLLASSASSINSDGDDSEYCTCTQESIHRRQFPQNFLFGASSASYQVEGAYNENGKGPSMWDNFTHTYPERILNGSNGDVAVDSYHLYKEDVKLLKEMGADAYKFSISWPRILPGGAICKGVNQDGINYYNNLINELLANGIQPWVTLLHFDLPQALQDAYGGFLSPLIVKDFQDFAELLFLQFGDRVKNWVTMNEPWTTSFLGYGVGAFAPGRCTGAGCLGGDSATEPYIVTHNQLLAHAAAVNLYRDKYQEVQKGKIGISLNSYWFLPYDNTSESAKARVRGFDFMLGWFLDPIAFGRYPESMRERVGERLPQFTKEEEELVKGSFDFIGLNYYSGKYAVSMEGGEVGYNADSGFSPQGESKNGIAIGEEWVKGGSRYNVYPKGLRLILRYLKLRYDNPVIYITENGLDEERDDSIPISEALKDYNRKKCIFEHLCCLRQAIEEDGVKVKGYMVWSLTDNYLWAAGFSRRLGLNYVDYGDKSLPRYPKLSAQWLRTIIGKPPFPTSISDH